MKPRLLTFLLCLSYSFSWCQPVSHTDSLLKLLNNYPTDTGKINIISKLVLDFYNHSSYDSVIEFAGKGLELSMKSGDKKKQAGFYQWLGVAHHYKGSYEMELQNDLLALHIDEDINNKKGISAILGNIGSIYYDNMKDNDKALDFYTRSIQIKNELGDKNGAAIMYNNVGNIYTDLKEYKQAIDYESKSLEIFKETGDKDGEARTLNYLGNIYTFKEDYEPALQYRLHALQMSHEIRNREIETDSEIGLGLIYRKTKKYPEAMAAYRNGLAISKDIDFKLGEKNALEGLANTAVEQHDYKSAWDYQSQAGLLKDSLQNIESNKRMAELQVKYETEKKEREIQQMAKANAQSQLQLEVKANQLLLSIGAAIVVLLVLVVLYTRYRASQQKKMAVKESEMSALKDKQQQELLHTVIHTQEQEREKLAADLHDGLGQMLTAAKMNLNNSMLQLPDEHAEARNNIQSSLKRVNEALEESKTLASGLLPLNMRDKGLVNGIKEICDRNNNLKQGLTIQFFSSDIPSGLPAIVEINVYRICQELITNVIKHAKASSGNLQLFYRDQSLVIQMEDNGSGISQPGVSGNGLGLKNIGNRVQLLSGEMNIDTGKGKGTTFIIHIPVQRT